MGGPIRISPAFFRSPLCGKLSIGFAAAFVSLEHQTTAPNSAPTPYVIAIASAPQNVTLVAPTLADAPPARAASPPRIANNTRHVPVTAGASILAGARNTTTKGTAAPIE